MINQHILKVQILMAHLIESPTVGRVPINKPMSIRYRLPSNKISPGV